MHSIYVYNIYQYINEVGWAYEGSRDMLCYFLLALSVFVLLGAVAALDELYKTYSPKRSEKIESERI